MNIRKIISLIIVFSCIILPTFVLATEDNTQYIAKDENGNVKIYSEAAILIEASTGKILLEKNGLDMKYPASTTKIMTAILAIENCSLEETATASEYAVNSVKSGYTKANIQVGETFTVGQLLDVMMIQSANEAATILAEHIAGSEEKFANLMNEKAKQIGCQNTHFVNANGMHHENHYSTAYDMAMIARYCMQNETFRNIASKMECSLPTTPMWQEERIFKNTNSLMNPTNRYYYPYCNGIKTGFTTPAKNCLIASANKDGFELITVILHAESTQEELSARYLDTISLFNYGYSHFQLEEIQEEYDMIAYGAQENKNQKPVSSLDQEQTQVEVQQIDTQKTNWYQKDMFKIVCGIFILIIWIAFKRKRKAKHTYLLYPSRFHS